MTMQLRKATRKQAKLRVGLSGPSGSGKTYSALLLAKGLVGDWGKIALIDTENGSGELYSDLGEYNTLTLTEPFSPERYIEAIEAAQNAGMEAIIIDSMSHEWDGKGGCLEINELLAQTKFKGNTWAAWSETTPRHQKFVQKLLQSPCHIITTVRNKIDTVQTDDKKVKKVGTKEIQREGFEYELTANFNIDRDNHYATASKDRTNLFENRDPFIITEETGEELKAWNEAGDVDVNALKRQVIFQLRDRLGVGLPDEKNEIALFVQTAIPKLTDLDYSEEHLAEIVAALEAIEDKDWAMKTAWGAPEEEEAVPEKSEEPEEDLSEAI